MKKRERGQREEKAARTAQLSHTQGGPGRMRRWLQPENYGRSDKLGGNSRVMKEKTVLRSGATFSEPNTRMQGDTDICIYRTIEAE